MVEALVSLTWLDRVGTTVWFGWLVGFEVLFFFGGVWLMWLSVTCVVLGIGDVMGTVSVLDACGWYSVENGSLLGTGMENGDVTGMDGGSWLGGMWWMLVNGVYVGVWWVTLVLGSLMVLLLVTLGLQCGHRMVQWCVVE
jgi:hypothetical protein